MTRKGNESETPFAFPIPGRLQRECVDCGQEFQGREDQDACTGCSYLRTHPEARDGYWTWTRGGEGRWDIITFWPKDEPPPEPGATVTVHRRDGTSGRATILEAREPVFNMAGRARLRCLVREGAER